jgi:hypothetical protein
MKDHPNVRSRILIGLALAALMAATRGQQFAPLGHHLPDASLAVFFLAGVYLREIWSFGVFFLLATLIDAVAIGWAGVSSYCMTTAYWMLIPAYGALWSTGLWYRTRHRAGSSTLPLLAGALLVGGAIAEVLASGGFYFLSGRFTDPSLSGLLGRLATYLPATLLHLFAYTCAAAIVHLSLTASRSASHHERVSSK